MNVQKILEDHFTLTIYCTSLGQTSHDFFMEQVSYFNQNMSSVKLDLQWREEMHSKTRVSIQSRQWEEYPIFLKYITQIPTHDWKESQIWYHCFGGLAFYDAKNATLEQFDKDVLKFHNLTRIEKMNGSKVLAFNADPEIIKEKELEKHIVFMPTTNSDEELKILLSNELQSMLVNIGSAFSQGIIQLKGEMHTFPLFNSKEEIPTNQSKTKKRKAGRSYKLIADYQLLLGAYEDSLQFYKTAFETLKSNDDHIWLSKTYESVAALAFYKMKIGLVGNPLAVEGDFLAKFNDAIIMARKSKHPYFDVEAYFKLMHSLQIIGAKTSFLDKLKMFFEHFSNALNEEDLQKCLIRLASCCFELRLYRKAGLYLKMAGQSAAANQNTNLALNLYLTAFPLYNMPLTRELLPDDYPKNKFMEMIQAREDIPKVFKKTWATLQCQLLNDTLAVASSKPALQTKIIALALHHFKDELDSQAQFHLFGEMLKIATNLPKTIRADLTLIPQILKVQPLPEVMKVNIREVKSAIKPEDQEKAKEGGIFIINPWKKGGISSNDMNWMQEKICYVKVFLKNAFDFEIFLDSLVLVIEGVESISYPASLILKNIPDVQEVTLKFKALQPGTAHIVGIISKFTTFESFQPIDKKGVSIPHHEISKLTKGQYGIQNIPIKPTINTMKIYFEDTHNVIELLESSHFSINVRADNNSDSPLMIQRIRVSFAFKDNTTLDRELVPSQERIDSFDHLSIVVHRSIREDEGVLVDTYKGHPHALLNTNEIHNIDKLFKIYVKLVYYDKEKPHLHIEENIAKEVYIRKGLVMDRFIAYDSFASNETLNILERPFKHYNLDDQFNLTFELQRDDPEGKEEFDMIFKLNLEKNDEDGVDEKLLYKGIYAADEVSLKVILPINRNILQSQQNLTRDGINKLICGKWKKLGSIDNGYFVFDDKCISSIQAKYDSINYSAMILPGLNQKDGAYEAQVDDIFPITVSFKANIPIEQRIDYTCSILVTDDIDFNADFMQKKQDSILYQGKTTFNFQLFKEEKEIIHNIEVMPLEKRTYKVFVFVLDEANEVVYSYRMKECIQVV